MTTPQEELNRFLADKRYLEDLVKLAREKFDTVQIFCSRHEKDRGTRVVTVGDGNFFARLGQVSMWVEGERAVGINDTVRDSHDEADEDPNT